MEFMQCFENVRFIQKKPFYVVGMETDIHYNGDGGTNPIGDVWKVWKVEKIGKTIPDQVSPGITYGMTHGETTDNTAKYLVGVEVFTLENLPTGLLARKFEASEYAVFNTTLKILWTGEFWRTFYTKWLPNSGYAMHDSQWRDSFPVFNKHPDIEVYPEGFDGDAGAVLQIYAPVVKT